MSQEILYTSAPKLLKLGLSGYGTVVSTQGMPQPLADRLEQLSGYRWAFDLGDPRCDDNPVNHSYVTIIVAGQRYHVLSRISNYPADYSGRSNKIAHHVALLENELPPGGPAWVLMSPGFCEAQWDGQLKTIPTGRKPTFTTRSTADYSLWKHLTGDAGWAGVLAETALQEDRRPVQVIFPLGANTLALAEQALNLVPHRERWKVTFSTYYTGLPASVECLWQFVLDGTPEAAQLRRTPHQRVIDLASTLGPATGGPLVQEARAGRQPPLMTTPPAPAASPRHVAAAGVDFRAVPPPSRGVVEAPPPLPRRETHIVPEVSGASPPRVILARSAMALCLAIASVFGAGGYYLGQRSQRTEASVSTQGANGSAVPSAPPAVPEEETPKAAGTDKAKDGQSVAVQGNKGSPMANGSSTPGVDPSVNPPSGREDAQTQTIDDRKRTAEMPAEKTSSTESLAANNSRAPGNGSPKDPPDEGTPKAAPGNRPETTRTSPPPRPKPFLKPIRFSESTSKVDDALHLPDDINDLDQTTPIADVLVDDKLGFQLISPTGTKVSASPDESEWKLNIESEVVATIKIENDKLMFQWRTPKKDGKPLHKTLSSSVLLVTAMTGSQPYLLAERPLVTEPIENWLSHRNKTHVTPVNAPWSWTLNELPASTKLIGHESDELKLGEIGNWVLVDSKGEDRVRLRIGFSVGDQGEPLVSHFVDARLLDDKFSDSTDASKVEFEQIQKDRLDTKGHQGKATQYAKNDKDIIAAFNQLKMIADQKLQMGDLAAEDTKKKWKEDEKVWNDKIDARKKLIQDHFTERERQIAEIQKILEALSGNSPQIHLWLKTQEVQVETQTIQLKSRATANTK